VTLLAIETATDITSAVLLDGESLRADFAFQAHRDVCRRLVPDLQAMMARAQVGVESLSAVAVGRGPGSFTGIRIGVATAKGLALALGIPIFGISTLAACAYPAAGSGGVVAALIPAHGDELYAGVFRADEALTPLAERISSAREVLAYLSQLGQPVTFAPTARQVRDLLPLNELTVAYRFLPHPASWQLASWVGRLAQARLAAGEVGDGMGLAPVYLRASQAEAASQPPAEPGDA
jgi:tRNA threonylcarbamoyladenosine biosynthesis protein TsaB